MVKPADKVSNRHFLVKFMRNRLGCLFVFIYV